MTTLTVTSINVNGIRAATKKRSEDNLGMLQWLRSVEKDGRAPEVILLQEVRATEDQAHAALALALDEGWHWVGAAAAAKGRAGVGILSRVELRDVETGFGSFRDAGRWIEGTYPVGDTAVRVASLYLPSGAAGSPKQDEKYRFLDEFEEVLDDRADRFPHMVIGGDWNICHRREDLKNWKGNLKSSGFLPDERAFMDSVFGPFPDDAPQLTPDDGLGTFAGAVDYHSDRIRAAAHSPRWFDAARRLHPEGSGPYTWWTYRGQAFNNDAGWRIDYQAATRAMMDKATHARVDKADAVELRWSDHAPLTVTYGEF